MNYLHWNVVADAVVVPDVVMLLLEDCSNFAGAIVARTSLGDYWMIGLLLQPSTGEDLRLIIGVVAEIVRAIEDFVEMTLDSLMFVNFVGDSSN